MKKQFQKYPACMIWLCTCIQSLFAQNVGINQPNPDWPLDVIAPQGVVKLTSTNTGYGSVLELKNLYTPTDYLGAINFNDPASSYPGQIGYHANNTMTFRVGGFERMIIDNNGNVGIGTLTPDADIDIEASHAEIQLVTTSSSSASILRLRNYFPGATNWGTITFQNDGNTGGSIDYTSDHNMSFRRNGFEFMRANSTGVGISRIPQTNRFEVEGNASKFTAGDWLANSDARLKKNIRPLDSEEMLEKVLALKGIVYEWNDDKTGSARPEGIQYGFTAQDIQKVFPTLVEEDNLGFLQTAYGTYDPMMVEAIRALDEKINTLQAEIERLKQQVLDCNSDSHEIERQ